MGASGLFERRLVRLGAELRRIRLKKGMDDSEFMRKARFNRTQMESIELGEVGDDGKPAFTQMELKIYMRVVGADKKKVLAKTRPEPNNPNIVDDGVAIWLMI